MQTAKPIADLLPASNPPTAELSAVESLTGSIAELPASTWFLSPAYPGLTVDEVQTLLQTALPTLLLNAQKEKHYAQQRLAHQQKMAAMNYVPATPEQLFAEVQRRGRILGLDQKWRSPFALDKENSDLYRLLALYFTGSDRFETEGPALMGNPHNHLSLHKGLLLFGNMGVGKTVMMQLFARNPYHSFMVVGCRQIEREYDDKKTGGTDIINAYSVNPPCDSPSNFYGHRNLGICFDDLGSEEDGRFFGKQVNVMEAILENRYVNCRGPWTHLTTNLNLEEIEARYGGRVFDRMKQLFNLVEFSEKAESRRK